MATFIDFLLEDEQALEVSKFVNKIKTKGKEGDDAFEKECTKLIEGKQLVNLLNKLADESTLIFTEASDKGKWSIWIAAIEVNQITNISSFFAYSSEIEGFFFILVSLLKKLPKEGHHDVLMRIINALTSPREEKSLLRLRM